MTLRAGPAVVRGEEESQVKYRYLFVLLRVKSDWITGEMNIPYFFLCQNSLAQSFCEVSAEVGRFT